MLNRMLLRLFALPLFLLVSALAVLLFLGWFIPSQFRASPFLDGLGQQAAGLALPAYCVLIAAAVLVAIYQSVRLWRWRQGKGDFCDNCNGIVSVCNGRRGRGPYVHCLACGKNRPLR
jgi:hypothetical protein